MHLDLSSEIQTQIINFFLYLLTEVLWHLKNNVLGIGLVLD